MPVFREFFKSKKRKANEAAIKEAVDKGEGKVSVTARRVDNPKSTGKRLIKRGGSVTVGSKSVKIGEKTVQDPDKVTKTTEVIPGKTRVIMGDMSERNKITDRPTTPELGKKYKEDPDKTKKRIEAQKRGDTSYDIGGGKREYSGRKVKDPDETITKETRTPQSHKESITKNVKTLDVTQPPKTKRLVMRVQREAGSNKKGQGQNYLKNTLIFQKKVKTKDPITGEKKKTYKPVKVFSIRRKTKTNRSK